MSKTLDDKILEAFNAALSSVAEDVVPEAARSALAIPRMKALLTAKIEHEVQCFAENEMGVPPVLQFRDEFEFFDKYLVPAYETGGADQTRGWCARWFEHRSVRKRIEAMWHRYEFLARTDPGNCDEAFLRDVGDHHMDRLTGERSPMAACHIKHQPSKVLKTAVVEPTTVEGDLP